MTIHDRSPATWMAAVLVAVGVLSAAGCTSSVSSSKPVASSRPRSAAAASATFTARQIVLGTTLRHTYQRGGTGATATESLSQPDDIVALGGDLYVGFQNGVGSQGEPSASGNLDSTLVEITPSGSVVRQWDLVGKIDGMGADSSAGEVIVTVNEDSKSSLYTVSGGTVTHYTYTPSVLPHQGGTDAVAVDAGKVLVSASAPGTSGKAPASAAAVYVVTLNSGTKTAAVTPLFADNAKAISANGQTVTLALTDPDSNGVVPSASPAFAGDFMLNSQGDEELIFSNASGQDLHVLKLAGSVDDVAWATSASGTLFASDSSANTVDAITGPFVPGTAYTSVTPCNANSAPSTCPAPGYPYNYLGAINLSTGALTKITVPALTPKGLVFVP